MQFLKETLAAYFTIGRNFVLKLLIVFTGSEQTARRPANQSRIFNIRRANRLVLITVGLQEMLVLRKIRNVANATFSLRGVEH